MSDEPKAQPSLPFAHEIWSNFRPYLLAIVGDSLIAGTLWLALFGFRQLTGWLKIPGWAGEFIENIHAAGGVCCFILFGFLLILDLWRLRK